jgi:uncharacterized protein YoxC
MARTAADVKVTFSGDTSDLEKKLNKLEQDVAGTGREIEAATDKATKSGRGLKDMGDRANDAGDRLYALSDAISGTTNIMNGFSNGSLLQVGIGLVDVGRSVSQLASDFQSLATKGLDRVKNAFTQVGDDGVRSMNKLGTAMTATMGVAAVATAAYMANEVTKSMNKIEFNIERLVGASDEQMDKFAAGVKRAQEAGDKWGEGTNMLRQTHEQFRQTAERNIDTAVRLRDALAANGVETTAYDEIIKDVTESTVRKEEADERSQLTLDTVKLSTEDLRAANERHRKEVDDLMAAIHQYNAHLKEADSAVNDLMKSTFSIADAEGEWNESLLELTESVKKNGTELNTHTEAGNRNRQAVEGVIEQGARYLAQLYEQGGASVEFERTSDHIRYSIVQTMRQLGFGEDEIQRYVNEWNRVPSYIETNVAIKYHITTIRELMDEMDKTGFLASGGVVNTPLQIVGEEGPELAALPMGTRVFNNSETRSMLAGSGGSATAVGGQPIVVNIYNPVVRSDAQVNQLGDRMGRELAVALRGSVN